VSLVERAREVMGRHDLTRRLASLSQLADRLDHAEQAASDDRCPLRAALAAAEAETMAAMAGAVAELPPLGIAGTVASIDRAARRHLFRHVGSGACSEQRRGIVASLEALAKNVLDTWVPGFDADALRAVIVDEDKCRQLARPLAPLVRHAQLGFGPISGEVLASRIATQLDSESYRRARAVMAKEAADLERALAELAAVRRSKRFFSSDDARREAQADREVGRERAEAFVACEVVASAFHQALASFPPLAIWLAAETLIALHSGAAPPMEHAAHLDGVTRLIPAFTYRAFIVGALISFRRAVDGAFPGLLALVEGDEAEAGPRPERGRGSPFRVAAITSAGDDAKGEHVAELMGLYEQAGVRGLLQRASVHAVLAGAAGRSRANARLRVTALDRVAIWSDSLAETDEQVAMQRADWHRAALYGVATQISTTIWPLGQRFHALRVRDLLVRLSLAIGMVKTPGDTFSGDRMCPVMNKQLVLQVLAELASELSVFGPRHALQASLHEVRGRLDAVTAMRVRAGNRDFVQQYRCQLFGFGELCFAAQALARHAFAVIGEMPPDGLLLCHYVEQLGAGPGRG
jgi:hypothetical protein